MRRLFAGTCLVAVLTVAFTASAWNPMDDARWQRRNGPGIMGAIGSVACTRDICDDDWGQEYFGSIGATLGGYYRLAALFVFFGEINTSYLRLDRSGLSEDGGFLFQFIVGGELHIPISGWFEAYAGVGIGYAGVRTKGTVGGTELAMRLHGFDVEIRLGPTVYPSSSVPTLGVGPYMKLGLPVWGKTCDQDDTCTSRSDMPDAVKDELPILLHVGLEVRYGF